MNKPYYYLQNCTNLIKKRPVCLKGSINHQKLKSAEITV